MICFVLVMPGSVYCVSCVINDGQPFEPDGRKNKVKCLQHYQGESGRLLQPKRDERKNEQNYKTRSFMV
jgi:hypothetical protein